MIKQAVILAGGFGTRLRPITDTIPKPMLPVLGRPLLEWHIEQFKKFGVNEFFFTLHYLPEVVKNYFGDGSKFGVSIRYFIEQQPLGEAGGLKELVPFLDDEFFLIHGDTLSLLDYGEMELAWRSKKNALGIQRIGKSEQYADADLVEVDADLKFTVIHKRPHQGPYQNVYRMRGIYILKKEILSYIPADRTSNINADILPAALAAGESFYGYECDEYSKGISDVETWHKVEAYLKSHGF
jgi:mannose-1-phosphate guanylyltransferase / phosphomannomutase